MPCKSSPTASLYLIEFFYQLKSAETKEKNTATFDEQMKQRLSEFSSPQEFPAVLLPATLLAEALLLPADHHHRRLEVQLADLVTPVILPALAEICGAPVDQARVSVAAVRRGSGRLRWRHRHRGHSRLVVPLI
ncbi:hypothetical protein BHE74_00058506 [Ensete ventricosum]|uniref:Uncharacterized protein n=1 Tax=Ensete ventricosum TaxID=4639 RepID=A0A426YRR1_ENSVE|nr:hypothetical protein B296_00027591 [Ensete ventricosum]RWW36470.1 hypothetical protein BHE74_00058506 [Ensete ventricosum]